MLQTMKSYMRQGVTSGNVLWLAANGLSLIVLSMVLFRLQAPVTFFRFDGTFILTFVKNQAQWMPGLGAFTMDFLRGTGGLSFPLVHVSCQGSSSGDWAAEMETGCPRFPTLGSHSNLQ